MLDLSTAVLCDFAQVRDRLLFVSSGAVSRLYRRELPSPLGLMVGLIIEVPLEESGVEHTLRADVLNRHGEVLATLENTFRVGDEGLFPHEVQQVPLVLSITGVRARTWGTHQVRLSLDDELVRALTLYIVPAAGVAPVRPAAGEEQPQAVEPDAGDTADTTDAAPDAAADAAPEGDAEPDGASTGETTREETAAGDAPADEEAQWAASGDESPSEGNAGTDPGGEATSPTTGPEVEPGATDDGFGSESRSEGEGDGTTASEDPEDDSGPESSERRGRFGRW